MPYHTYILYSSRIGSFYKGQTSDLYKRISRHNNASEKSTKHGTPWTLIWSTSKSTRSEALKLESKLKNLSRRRLIEFMLKYKSGIPNDQLTFINDLSFES